MLLHVFFQQQGAFPKQVSTPTRYKNPLLLFTGIRGKRADVTDVLSTMSEALQRCTDNFVPKTLCLQIFSQLSWWINAVLFNKLMSNASLCIIITCNNIHFQGNCGTGFQIRMSLSQIEDFLAKIPFLTQSRYCYTFTPHVTVDSTFLAHINQASNLLVMDKSILLDKASASDAFGALSETQLAYLVQSFKPDSVSPAPISEKVLEEVAKYNNTGSLLLDPLRHVLPK